MSTEHLHRSKRAGPASPQSAKGTAATPPRSLLANSPHARTGSTATSRSGILKLQRTAGNRAVQRLLGDPSQQNLHDNFSKDGEGATQHQASRGLRHGGAADAPTTSAIQRARGGGQPLPGEVRGPMEQTLGADLGPVRVHVDAAADRLNRSMSAKAFTVGSDIFFSQGAYGPKSTGGRGLLAHELTHVVQQGGGKANRAQTKLAVGPPNDRFEQEADRVAAQATAASGPAGLTRPRPTASVAVQRKMLFDRTSLDGGLSRTAKTARMVGIESTFSKIRHKLDKYWATDVASEEAVLLEDLIELSRTWLTNHVKSSSVSTLKKLSVRRLQEMAEAELPEARAREKTEGPKVKDDLPDGRSKKKNTDPNAKLGLGFGALPDVEDAFGRKGEVKGNLGTFAKKGGYKGLAAVSPEKQKQVMNVVDRHNGSYLYDRLYTVAKPDAPKEANWYDEFKAKETDQDALGRFVEDVKGLCNDGNVGPMTVSEVTGIYLVDLQTILGLQFKGKQEMGGKAHSPLHVSTLNAMHNASEIGNNLAGFTDMNIRWAKTHDPRKITDAEAAAAMEVKTRRGAPMAENTVYANDDVAIWNRMDMVTEGNGVKRWPTGTTPVSVWEFATIYHTPSLLEKTKFYNHRTGDSEMKPIQIGKLGEPKKLGLGFGTLPGQGKDAFGRKGEVKANLDKFLVQAGFKYFTSLNSEAGIAVAKTLQKHPLHEQLQTVAGDRTKGKTWYTDFAAKQDQVALAKLVETYRMLADKVGPMSLSGYSGIWLVDLETILGTEFETAVDKTSGKARTQLGGGIRDAMWDADEIGSNLAGFSSLQAKWAKTHNPAEITDEEAAAVRNVTEADESRSQIPKASHNDAGKEYAKDDMYVWQRMDLVKGPNIKPWPNEVTPVSIWELATIYHNPALLKKTKFYNYRDADSKVKPINIGKVGAKK